MTIEILSTVMQIDMNQACYEVLFVDISGKENTLLIGCEKFLNRTEAVRILVGAGAPLSTNLHEATKQIDEALAARGKSVQKITNRVGWREGSFVYYGKTIGASEVKLSQIASYPELGMQAGHLEAYREGLRVPCQKSDYLIFAMSVPAAGTLLSLLGDDEGALYHLHGAGSKRTASKEERTDSSSGKTLTTRTAASTIGKCQKNDLVTLDITPRAIEELCFAHNNLAAFFDEEGRVPSGDGKAVRLDTLPYVVTSGKGKVRSNKAVQDSTLQNLTWCLCALSNGEKPIDGPDRSRSEGSQVRMLPLPVPPGARGGIFNRVAGTKSQVSQQCKKLARQVESTITANYGVLMPAYLDNLVFRADRVKRPLRRFVDEFVREVDADGKSLGTPVC